MRAISLTMDLEAWMETPAPRSTPSAMSPASDRPSFEEVYDTEVETTWRGLRRLGVRDSDLDDAVQDVFVVVHRKLDDFEGRSSIRTWLFGIVIRVARRYRRGDQRHPETPLEGEVEATLSGGTLPDAQAADAEAVRILYALLEELDEEKREAFVMAELEELSAPEIAEALSLNLNTVYARIRAARKAFEQAVARQQAKDDWRTR